MDVFVWTHLEVDIELQLTKFLAIFFFKNIFGKCINYN